MAEHTTLIQFPPASACLLNHQGTRVTQYNYLFRIRSGGIWTGNRELRVKWKLNSLCPVSEPPPPDSLPRLQEASRLEDILMARQAVQEKAGLCWGVSQVLWPRYSSVIKVATEGSVGPVLAQMHRPSQEYCLGNTGVLAQPGSPRLDSRSCRGDSLWHSI